jgi:hypothetical protein
MSCGRRQRSFSGREDTKRRRPKICVLPWELDAKAYRAPSHEDVDAQSVCLTNDFRHVVVRFVA